VKGSHRSLANAAAQAALIAHWQGIVRSLGNFLNTLKANHVRICSLDMYYFHLFLCFLRWVEPRVL